MIYRCILPDWAKQEFSDRKKVREGKFSDESIHKLNSAYYNIYYLPNYPDDYKDGSTVDGSQITHFESVYVDMDLKEGKYKSKQEFIELLSSFNLFPTKVVDSGNGVHAYWKIDDLDAMTYLKLQRRLCRYFNTDPAVSKIYQLMRVPGTLNTKNPNDLKLCELIYDSNDSYTAEQMDNVLPQLTKEDYDYCQTHYSSTYDLDSKLESIDTKMPAKWGHLIRTNQEVKNIFTGNVDDRSEADFRLGHILFATGFTKAEAMSVLVNVQKAITRAPRHRIAYAENIVDKIWTYEITKSFEGLELSSTVKDILGKGTETLQGTRFRCYNMFDDTARGFRLGDVLGLVAGSGVGKTAFGLNMFMGFVEFNPDYEHFIVALEQPANEIAEHWKTMCGEKTHLYDKVHIISNYADDNTFRQLSFTEIKDYILRFQAQTGKKIGSVMIDHIGALKKEGKDGENQDLITICHEMKGFAIETNTLLIMQSQTNREKAGIGDLELNKDAAYGTTMFEWYCDYLVTLWQPLKRCYDNPACPTVTAFKYCKIRHKKKDVDKMQEDKRYLLYFDPLTERLREMTQAEETSFSFFNKVSTKERNKDRKIDLITYTSLRVPTTGETQTNV